MDPVKGLFGFLLFVLIVWCQASGAAEIILFEPDVQEGEVYQHDSAVLRLEGEIHSDGEILSVTVNGKPGALGSRDLVVEELATEGTPFRGVVQLQAGQTPILIEARSADGQTVSFSFKGQLAADELSGRAYALIVGIDDYGDDRIADLRFAEADAQEAMAAFTDPQYGIVAKEDVRLLLGEDATFRQLNKALEEHLVRQATRPQDIAIFYFAGHGAEGAHISRGAAYYLVPQDAELTNLLSTAIDKSRLQFLWGAIAAERKFFITDACHSGGLQNMKVLSADGFETVEGYVTLAAASADQQSWELPQLGHGIFTHSLSQGLRGAADKAGDGDGLVSAAELGRFLEQNVPQMAAEIGADQNPVVELAPGAKGAFLATSGGKPLPPWQGNETSEPQAFAAQIKVEMRFATHREEPYVLVALRDEDGDPAAEEVAVGALMERFLDKGTQLHFVEPAAVQGKVGNEGQSWLYGGDPAAAAAVARAVAADMVMVGQFKAVATGELDEQMKEMLGNMASFQSHLNLKVIDAANGEVLGAANVNTPAAHLNGEMARRKAIEKSSRKVADKLRRSLLTRWKGRRPGGILVAENVDGLDFVKRLETALATLEPTLNRVAWQSFSEGRALFSFESASSAADVAARLEEGLGELKVGQIKADETKVSFYVNAR